MKTEIYPIMYKSLMALVETNEAFYFKDYKYSNNVYRVFNYRLANYSDFCEPCALEARGITFLIKANDNEVTTPVLVSRPFKKFFNLGENPFTMNLDFSTGEHYIAVKEDGSIISTFYDSITHVFGLKSKQDFFSTQSVQALSLIKSPGYKDFYDDLFSLSQEQVTVIMEFVSPTNRIVLQYPRTELRVLALRDNVTGEILDPEILKGFPSLKEAFVSNMTKEGKELEDFIAGIPEMKDIEGYVITTPSGLMVKVKTEWYKSLHHLKDSVNHTRHLFESIIDETIDDVKTMLGTDEFTMNRIKSMEDIVIPKYNHIIKTVEDFFTENMDLDRKSFAIKGTKDLGRYFSLAMNRYLDKHVDYKGFAKKFMKEEFNVSEEMDVTYE